MAEERDSSENTEGFRARRRRTWAGVTLILVGCYLLASQFVPGRIMGMLAAPGIGALCLVWGAANRSAWLIIVGGVVFGSGAGSFLSNEVFWRLNSPANAGVILLGMAIGWFLIPVLSVRFAGAPQRWALVPAVVMTAVGVPLVLSSAAPAVLQWVATWWPALLVAAGVLLLLRQGGRG